jgi:hypothetical protein
MSNKSVRVAADLSRFQRVTEIRYACRNARYMGGVEALRMFGNAPISTYAQRLKCSKCGRRLAAVDVVPLPQR